MVPQRKKLSLKHRANEAEESLALQPATGSERDSPSVGYHPSHDPQLVTDDDIPW